MAMDRQAARDLDMGKLPYLPSWIDRLDTWIEGLSGPVWLTYLFGLAGAALIINAAFWIDGSAPVGSFDPYNTGYAVFVMYWPALYHYLTRIATRSLHAFRPLLDVSDSEFNAIDYEFRTLPSREGWLSIPLGFGIAIIQTISDPQSFGDIIPNTILPSVGDTVITGFLASAFLCLLFRSVRQLRMVSALHARAAHIDLLELEPARSFSDLTARTGIGLILLLIAAYAADPLSFGSASSILLSAATLVAGIAIFVLPITGIQNRIEQEKGRTLHQIHDLLQSTRDQLHHQVKGDNYKDMGEVNHAMEALMRERTLIMGVPTWPWNPRTLRGFASTLLLPIFLWLVTRILERIL